MDRKHPDPSHPEDCFGCRIHTIQWAPSATPSRRNNIPPRTPNNAFERGIAEDRPGMPLLDKNLNPIGLKEAADLGSTLTKQIRAAKTPTVQPERN